MKNEYLAPDRDEEVHRYLSQSLEELVEESKIHYISDKPNDSTLVIISKKHVANPSVLEVIDEKYEDHESRAWCTIL